MDNIIIIFVLFSIFSSIIRSFQKKQQAKPKTQSAVQDKQSNTDTYKFPPREQPIAKKPPSTNTVLVASKADSKPVLGSNFVPVKKLDRAFELMPVSSDYVELLPRFEEPIIAEVTGDGPGSIAQSADNAILDMEEEQNLSTGIQLSFQKDALIQGIVMSEILNHPQEQFLR